MYIINTIIVILNLN